MIDSILKQYSMINEINENFYMIKLWIVLKEARRVMENQKTHNNEDNSFGSIDNDWRD